MDDKARRFLKDAPEVEFTPEEWLAWAKMKGPTPYQLFLRDEFEKKPVHTAVM